MKHITANKQSHNHAISPSAKSSVIRLLPPAGDVRPFSFSSRPKYQQIRLESRNTEPNASEEGKDHREFTYLVHLNNIHHILLSLVALSGVFDRSCRPAHCKVDDVTDNFIDTRLDANTWVEQIELCIEASLLDSVPAAVGKLLQSCDRRSCAVAIALTKVNLSGEVLPPRSRHPSSSLERAAATAKHPRPTTRRPPSSSAYRDSSQPCRNWC